MPTVMIIGASRGIGLELARQYAKDGWRVHATTRTPAQPGPLVALAGDIALHALEVRNAAQIAALAVAVEHEGIDVLIHNAGVSGWGVARAEVFAALCEDTALGSNAAQSAALAVAVEHEGIDVLIHNAGVSGWGMPRAEVMAINADAPIRVTQALLPAVIRSTEKKIVLVTSQLGARYGRRRSLGLYGDSKAALNDALRALAPEWGQQGVI